MKNANRLKKKVTLISYLICQQNVSLISIYIYTYIYQWALLLHHCKSCYKCRSQQPHSVCMSLHTEDHGNRILCYVWHKKQ